MKVIEPGYVTGFSTFFRASAGTYFDKNKVLLTAGNDVQRVNWNPDTGVFEGVLVEPARTNLLLNSGTALATQTRPVVAGTTYTLTYYGTGSITLTGAAGATVQSIGAFPKRTRFTFVATSSSLTLTVSGSVTLAQLEAGSYPTSYIFTGGGPATRAADIVGPPGMFQTTFPQPHPGYAAGTTYSTGQVVAQGIRLYESLVDGNVGNTPPAAQWLDIGPTNYFACVDQKIIIASVGPGPLQTFALKLDGPVNAAGFVGVKGTKVHIAINDLNGNIYTNSSDTMQSALALVAHPGGPIVSVCVENTAGDVRIGEFIAGAYVEIGETHYGASMAITDYSRKDTDEFGTTTFVERPFARRVSSQVLVKKSNYNKTVQLFEAIRARPTVFVMTDDAAYSDGMVVYGNCSDFDMQIAYPNENLLNIEIQGLI